MVIGPCSTGSPCLGRLNADQSTAGTVGALQPASEVSMRRSLLISLLLLFPFVGIAQTVDPARSMRTVPAEFFEVVNHYVEIHRAIADSHRPEILCANDEELQRQTWAFAAAIRETRPNARTGNIFSPAVAEFFRAHIADVVRRDPGRHRRTARRDGWRGARGNIGAQGEHGIPVECGKHRVAIDVVETAAVARGARISVRQARSGVVGRAGQPRRRRAVERPSRRRGKRADGRAASALRRASRAACVLDMNRTTQARLTAGTSRLHS